MYFKIFLLFGFLLCFGFNKVKADHLLGFDISYEIDSVNNTLRFFMTAYRDCQGIAGSSYILLNLQSNRGCFRQVGLMQQGSTSFINYACGLQYVNSCSDGANIIEIFNYESDDIPLSSSCGDSYVGTVQSCCRSASITNITAPSNTQMQADITFNIRQNKSPKYDNLPIQSFCAGQAASYVPQIVELDGDSLKFEMIPVFGANFYSGYSYGQPLLIDAGTTFNINSQTGEITFTPRTGINQFAVLMVKISEYRNGILIGTQTRELYFIVLANCVNTAPILTALQANNLPHNANDILYYCPGEDLNIDFVVTDIDSGQTLSLNSPINQVFPNVVINSVGTNPMAYNIFIPSSDLVNPIYVLNFLVLDDYCPSSSVSLSLNLRSRAPEFEILAPFLACSGNEIELSVNRAFQSYLWSTGDTTRSITVDGTLGDYSVTVSNGANCEYTATQNINLLAPIVYDLDIEHINCNTTVGSVHLISSNPDYVYMKDNIDYNYDGIFDGLNEGVYLFSIVDLMTSCRVDTTIEILRNIAPIITPNSIPNIVCLNENITLGIQENYATYLWSTGATTATINTDGSTRNYSLTITDNNGCLGNYTFDINYSFPIDFVAEIIDNPCENDSIGQLILRHIPAAILYDYAISSGDTAVYYGQFNNLASGNYTITATDANGCTRIENYTVNTLSYLQLLGLTSHTIIEEGNTVSLYSLVNSNANIISENWTLPIHITNPQYSNTSDVNIQPLQSDIYRFYIENEHGCFIDTSIYIQVIEVPQNPIIDSSFVLEFPTAFTPNGDGENDYFKPIGIPLEFVEKMQIFNRWGNIVYEGDLSDNGWNGNYKNEAQARDIYIVLLKYRNAQNESKTYRGEFMLVR